MSDQHIECRTYTRAVRHPVVIGRIGNTALPWQFTLPQVVAMLTTFAVLAFTWRAWARFSDGADVVVFGAAIIASALLTRARIEGRNAFEFALGWIEARVGWRQPAGGGRRRWGGRP